MTVTLCRYDAQGFLSRQTSDIFKTSYIAVSHVWGKVSWRHIAGLEPPVLASSQKARFLENELPGLVGTNLFWMDILCIDQTTDTARSEMIKHAPAIYGHARKTIVIREDGGFRECCKDPVLTFFAGSFRRPPNDVPVNWVQKHVSSHGIDFEEVWLNRLWPVQEVSWSNAVQFTVCSRTENERRAPQTLDEILRDRPWMVKPTLMQTYENLKSLAENWFYRGDFPGKPTGWCQEWELFQYREKHCTNFVKAMLFNGTVERIIPDQKKGRISIGNLIQDSFYGTLRATDSRDYILTTFVEYDWYRIPGDVATMTFDEIWVDLWQQLQQADIPSKDLLTPKIPIGVLEPFMHTSLQDQLPTNNVPEPLCFQDFSGLFLCKPEDAQGEAIFHNDWDVGAIEENDPMERILNAIGDTFSMVDILKMPSWLLQYKKWTETAQTLRSLLQYTDSPQNQQEAKLFVMFQDLVPLLSTGAPGGIVQMLIVTQARLRAEVPRLFLPEASEKVALSNLTQRFIREWYMLLQVLEYNVDPQSKKGLLDVSAGFCCGLPLTSLSWSRKNLRPYLLRSKGEIHIPNQGRQECANLLFLASPRLNVDDLYDLKAHTSGLPFVTAKSKSRSTLGDQIIGLAPYMGIEAPQGYLVLYDRARPVIIPIEPEVLSEEVEESNETNYRALRHWDAMFEKRLWGPEPSPQPGQIAQPGPGPLQGDVRYGTLSASIDVLRICERDDRDPYAYEPRTKTRLPFTQRIIYYSVLQSKKYRQETVSRAISPNSTAPLHRQRNTLSPSQLRETFIPPSATNQQLPSGRFGPQPSGFQSSGPIHAASGLSSHTGQAQGPSISLHAGQNPQTREKKPNLLRRMMGRKRG